MAEVKIASPGLIILGPAIGLGLRERVRLQRPCPAAWRPDQTLEPSVRSRCTERRPGWR